jgi:hypothetical protein
LKQAFGILFSLYRGTGNNNDWIVACLAEAWPKILGDRLAAVCRPVLFRNSELVIELLDNGWEGAFKSVQPDLLNKLQTATAGEVKFLSVRKIFSRQ